jgi:hypothetical protein
MTRYQDRAKPEGHEKEGGGRMKGIVLAGGVWRLLDAEGRA